MRKHMLKSSIWCVANLLFLIWGSYGGLKEKKMQFHQQWKKKMRLTELCSQHNIKLSCSWNGKNTSNQLGPPLKIVLYSNVIMNVVGEDSRTAGWCTKQQCWPFGNLWGMKYPKTVMAQMTAWGCQANPEITLFSIFQRPCVFIREITFWIFWILLYVFYSLQ